MTTLRSSQLGTVAVAANPTAAGLRASQLSAVALTSNPAAAGMRMSQFAVVAVIANNHDYKSLGPAIDLGCWTPCGTLAFNGE